MTRDDVLALIIRHLRQTVEGADRVDPARPMRDLGATSLDVDEVVTRATRELGIRVTRAAVAGLTDVDGLADLFYLAVNDAGRLGLVRGIAVA